MYLSVWNIPDASFYASDFCRIFHNLEGTHASPLLSHKMLLQHLSLPDILRQMLDGSLHFHADNNHKWALPGINLLFLCDIFSHNLTGSHILHSACAELNYNHFLHNKRQAGHTYQMQNHILFPVLPSCSWIDGCYNTLLPSLPRLSASIHLHKKSILYKVLHTVDALCTQFHIPSDVPA